MYSFFKVVLQRRTLLNSQAVIPCYLYPQNSLRREGTFIALGVALLSLLSQVSFKLPIGPVPITGQTFGVALLALSWGQKRSTLTFLIYLLLGGLGLPVFSAGHSGLSFGPTLGYLIGMAASCYLVGLLADKGYTNSFKKAFFAASMGSVLVFCFGLLVLSRFVPANQLLISGLLPFIPGDVIKNLAAASISAGLKKRFARNLN